MAISVKKRPHPAVAPPALLISTVHQSCQPIFKASRPRKRCFAFAASAQLDSVLASCMNARGRSTGLWGPTSAVLRLPPLHACACVSHFVMLRLRRPALTLLRHIIFISFSRCFRSAQVGPFEDPGQPPRRSDLPHRLDIRTAAGPEAPIKHTHKRSDL